MTHSFPTRRASDLAGKGDEAARRDQRHPGSEGRADPGPGRQRRHHVVRPRHRATRRRVTEDAAPAAPDVLRPDAVALTPLLLFLALFFGAGRSEEHTSELQALMRNSYAGLC